MKPTLESSLRQIVADDFRAAAVFEHFGIDFCCGGRRTVRDACADRKLNPEDVLKEVNQACGPTDPITPRFANWGPDALIAHIVDCHHGYVRRALPSLVAHGTKVAAAHGEKRAELKAIAALVEEVAAEMTAHMAKEEQVLFPYIVTLAAAARRGEPAPFAPFGSVEKPIAVMEDEHESAGRAMERIRELSDNYAVPSGACTTYQVWFRELEAFERDLHVHVHLENNILFPKARALENR